MQLIFLSLVLLLFKVSTEYTVIHRTILDLLCYDDVDPVSGFKKIIQAIIDDPEFKIDSKVASDALTDAILSQVIIDLNSLLVASY